MIHFFPTFAKDPSQSPFVVELRATGVAHRVIADHVSLSYRSRLGLVFLGWPKLLAFAARAARESLWRSDPPPDDVALNSDIEVIVFGLARALVPRARATRITLLSFIYTRRRSRLLTALRRRYFRAVFGFADLVVCHSTVELREYRAVFDGCRARFAFMPYAMHVSGRAEAVAEAAAAAAADPELRRYVLAAGRSGRDYRTLFAALRGTDVKAHVVCDSDHALAGLDVPPNVRVLRGCYGNDYVRELAGAALVVVPLAVSDISAGQMVMIQAMAFARPVIVTDTATIVEYVSDGVEARLVPLGDAVALRAAIVALLDDPAEASRLGAAGQRAYDTRFSMRSYVRNLVAVIGVRSAARGRTLPDPTSPPSID